MVWRRLPSVYALLHRLGYSSLRPRPRHRKADTAAMTEFLQQLPNRLAVIAAAHPDRRLRIYFEDESRFGQQGTITNVWARRSSRPTAVRQTEYQYLWVLGTVCPETGNDRKSASRQPYHGRFEKYRHLKKLTPGYLARLQLNCMGGDHAPGESTCNQH